MARELYANKVTFFPLKEDGTYDVPVKLPWCVNLGVTFTKATKEYKADGRIERSVSLIEGADISLELSSDLPPSVESKFTGEIYSHGMSVTTATTTPITGALAYEIGMDDSTVRRRLLYGVTLTKDEMSNATDSEGETFKYSGRAIGDVEGNIKVDMDQKEVMASNDTEIKAKFDNFFVTPVEL